MKYVKASKLHKPFSQLMKGFKHNILDELSEIFEQHGSAVHLEQMAGLLNTAFLSDAHVNRELFVRNAAALEKVPEGTIGQELEPEGRTIVSAREPRRGDVFRPVEGYENPVKLTLVPLIPIPDHGLFLAVNRDHGFELDDIVVGPGVGPHLIPAARACVGFRPLDPVRDMGTGGTEGPAA